MKPTDLCLPQLLLAFRSGRARLDGRRVEQAARL